MNQQLAWRSNVFDLEKQESATDFPSSSVFSTLSESSLLSIRPRTYDWLAAGRSISNFKLVMRWEIHDTSDLTNTESSIASMDKTAECESYFRIPLSRKIAYKERIEVMREYGAEDGLEIDGRSELDFWLFANSEPEICLTNIVLLDNGCLRVGWKDGDGTQLGIQFLGDSMLHYVIFKKRHKWKRIVQTTGIDSFERFMRLVDEYELWPLITK